MTAIDSLSVVRAILIGFALARLWLHRFVVEIVEPTLIVDMQRDYLRPVPEPVVHISLLFVLHHPPYCN